MRPRPRRIRVTSKSLFYAIIIHVAAAVLLVLNIDWPTHVASSQSKPAPVQASVVSEAEIQKQMEAIQEKEQAEERRQQEAQEKLEELLQQKEAEEQRLAEIKERQQQEQQEAEELARQKEQERQELAKLKQQEEEQRQQEQAEAERRKQEEAEAERRRQEEAEAERKRQEEAERKRQEEEERKRKEAEEQRQRELAEKRAREKALQEQLEEERLASRVQSALGQYIPIIQQKVGRNWNRPAGLRDSIEAHVNVRLSQAGEVLSARIVKSSGNPVFDRSVENAVLKASPLPIPQEQGVNDRFRNMNLRFRPEDMTS